MNDVLRVKIANHIGKEVDWQDVVPPGYPPVVDKEYRNIALRKGENRYLTNTDWGSDLTLLNDDTMLQIMSDDEEPP